MTNNILIASGPSFCFISWFTAILANSLILSLLRSHPTGAFIVSAPNERYSFGGAPSSCPQSSAAPKQNIYHSYRSRRWYSTSATSPPLLWSTETVGSRISINEQYPGIKLLHANPDIYIIEDFLDDDACQDLITAAQTKKLEPSPVAYAGWTQDFKDLVELAAKGPVAWLALAAAWVQLKDVDDASQLDLVVHSLQNYAVIFTVATVLIAAFTLFRAEGLKSLRTSTSTTIDDINSPVGGARKFVENAARLFNGNPESPLSDEASLFEAPTVIRYEADQVLAPHFDANRSAENEDANRGGQTLATLIVYLNDVKHGGATRFGRLFPKNVGDNKVDDEHLTIQPKAGGALLFFPADSKGRFDERTEHEGCPAIDEKWIARIWRHQNRVPPPFGLTESSLQLL